MQVIGIWRTSVCIKPEWFDESIIFKEMKDEKTCADKYFIRLSIVFFFMYPCFLSLNFMFLNYIIHNIISYVVLTFKS